MNTRVWKASLEKYMLLNIFIQQVTRLLLSVPLLRFYCLRGVILEFVFDKLTSCKLLLPAVGFIQWQDTWTISFIS